VNADRIDMTAALQPTRAALLILAGMAVLGFSDNLVQHISATSSLWQFHLIRGGMVVLALALASACGGGALWPRKPKAVLARSAFMAGAMLIYFGCIAILPIGVVVAGLFTAPLFVLIISVLFQGKSVGWVRWLSVALGFIGALLVISPDPAALNLIAFLPIGAGLLYAIGAIATRAWCEDEDTLTLSVWFFGLLTLFGLIGVLVFPAEGTGAAGFPSRGWMPLTQEALGWFIALSIGALIGIVCIFKAYQIGEASYVAIFEYSLLVFASFWDWKLWGETVPALGLLGMAMIIGAGTIIAIRAAE
jgi:drug/metabolite transporter (DMT)-like permease